MFQYDPRKINPIGPPYPLKTFSPNGQTQEFEGYAGFIPSDNYPDRLEVFIFVAKTRKMVVLNPKVVILNLTTDNVIYDPRFAPRNLRGRTLLSEGLIRWLDDNPQWPAILEVYPHYVGEGKKNEEFKG